MCIGNMYINKLPIKLPTKSIKSKLILLTNARNSKPKYINEEKNFQTNEMERVRVNIVVYLKDNYSLFHTGQKYILKSSNLIIQYI